MTNKIIFIGTSHISPESIKKVKKTIIEKKPGIVAIELDRNRLRALVSKTKSKLSFGDIKRVGVKGWLFAMFGQWLQKKLGKKIGIMPGAEMLAAYKTARENNIQIALVDQNIEKTLFLEVTLLLIVSSLILIVLLINAYKK